LEIYQFANALIPLHDQKFDMSTGKARGGIIATLDQSGLDMYGQFSGIDPYNTLYAMPYELGLSANFVSEDCFFLGSNTDTTEAETDLDVWIPSVLVPHPLSASWKASLEDAVWVWYSAEMTELEAINGTTRAFRHRFTCSGRSEGTLQVAADNRVVAYLNGEELVTWTRFDRSSQVRITTKRGENELRFDVTNYPGQTYNPAGLLYRLSVGPDFDLYHKLHGVRAKLWRRKPNGDTEWAYARMSGFTYSRNAEQTMVFPVNFSWVVRPPWRGQSRRLAEQIPAGSSSISLPMEGTAVAPDPVFMFSPIESALTNLVVTKTDSKQVHTFSYTGTVNVGESLAIDCGARTIRSGEADRFNNGVDFSYGSSQEEWMVIAPSSLSPAYTVSISSPAILTVSYHDTYV
jgi:hypothetical protein